MKALQQSIEADRHYRDGFATATSQTCPLPLNADLKLGASVSARASATKRQFVAAFALAASLLVVPGPVQAQSPMGAFCGVRRVHPSRYDHVLWIWMETNPATS